MLFRCQIEFISFSAHVDYAQNNAFIRTVLPDNIILVHGERNSMKRLKEELDRDIRKVCTVYKLYCTIIIQSHVLMMIRNSLIPLSISI